MPGRRYGRTQRSGRSRRLGKVPGTLPQQGIECAGVVDQCGVCNGDGSICESGCGSACGCGGNADCNGNCWMGSGGDAGQWTTTYFDEYIGDGVCHNGLDGGPNLNCAMHSYDGGDCRPSSGGFQRGGRVKPRKRGATLRRGGSVNTTSRFAGRTQTNPKGKFKK